MSESMSIVEAAERLGISEQAVHKRIRSGSLLAAKTNGRWAVEEKSVLHALSYPPKHGRPWPSTTYMLMNGPYEVMEFTYREDQGHFSPGKVVDSRRAPLGTITRAGNGKPTGLRSWWEHRSIPSSRTGIDEKLASLGLADAAQIPFRNLGFSLSDQYWIRPEGLNIRWEDLNYFQNDFNTAEGDDRSEWGEWLSEVGLSSPDNTSEGALPKKWICRDGKRILLKGHNPWTDQQALNEQVATALHSRLLSSEDYVPYKAIHVDGLGLVSACPCFLASHEEYVPMNLALEAETKRKNEPVYDSVVRTCVNLGVPRVEVETSLAKMIVCDSILANTDRHLRNFGLIRDIHTLRWRMAPLFDSGNSLWFDKDEGAIARGDHSFVSRPFHGNPARQLGYVAALGWLDASKLKGFSDEACEILAEGDLSRWRLDYLREGLEARIAAVRELVA